MNRPCATSKQSSPFALELSPLPAAASPYPPAAAPNIDFSCAWPSPFNPGQPLRLGIPTVSREITIETLVIDCTAAECGYLLALAFPDPEQAYRFRMLLQLSHIQHFHQQQQNQGRPLSLNEAAGEWISRFAHNFPSISAFIQG